MAEFCARLRWRRQPQALDQLAVRQRFLAIERRPHDAILKHPPNVATARPLAFGLHPLHGLGDHLPRPGDVELAARFIVRRRHLGNLSQRDDLSEAEANATIDHVQDTIRGVLRTPQRLAVRAQAKVQDFQTTLEDYLRNTNKDELNPDGIQRDLRTLLDDPQAGVSNGD